MEPTLKSGAILMKFTQDVCMDEIISQTKNFKNWTGGRGTPHRHIFLTCMEPALKTAAILMKFTQNVRMDETISRKKKFLIGRARGVPLIDVHIHGAFHSKRRDLNEIHTECVYGRENIPDKKILKLDVGEGYPS